MRFLRGADDVGTAGVGGHADDGSAGIGRPVRRTKTGERGHEINPAVIGHTGGDLGDFRGTFTGSCRLGFSTTRWWRREKVMMPLEA